jgi:hypothetical protein
MDLSVLITNNTKNLLLDVLGSITLISARVDTISNPLSTVSSAGPLTSSITIMADAGGGKSGHDSCESYDGVVREASFGP